MLSILSRYMCVCIYIFETVIRVLYHFGNKQLQLSKCFCLLLDQEFCFMSLVDVEVYWPIQEYFSNIIFKRETEKKARIINRVKSNLGLTLFRLETPKWVLCKQ